MRMNVNLYTEEVQNWIKEIQSNRGRDLERVISFCDKVESFGRETSDDALIGFACFSRGETYYLMNDMRNFYAQMLACLAPMERIGEWGYVVMANNMLGIMSLNRGNAPFAMDYYMKALNYCHTYKLPDLEWIVHMNMGALYLNIEESQKALDHIENSYHYIMAHPERPDYIQNLMTAYLGMAKAYLNMELRSSAEKYSDKIRRECRPYLSPLDLLVVDCFEARLCREKGDQEGFREAVTRINEGILRDVPIMDIFDDLYEYMKMLLDAECSPEFISIYQVVQHLIQRTSIKNMEKKLLTLKIQYLKKTGQTNEYNRATIQYYEISEQMEKENRLMVTSMISMRNSLNDLAAINREVKQENIALHRKSEVDPLTGIYNRFKLNEYGEIAFEEACRNQTSLAIEILDIDYFKQYNDNYGHQAGDEAIKEVARMMQEMAGRGKIFCSRYGGDEFVIIYEGYTKDETMGLAQTLKKLTSDRNITHAYSKAEKYLTISQGICWGIPKTHEKIWDYLHAADELLYKVKKISRNSIRIGDMGEL
ncbi:MAG: GGDEF domain-containing protein [Lachnospiraceae bacterium]|nr:GGDEF domain-containing protein [Lachnospiraceae bacterium]